MRPLKPAPAKRTSYPRLGPAWRLLASAPLALAPFAAHADATIPNPGTTPQVRPQKPPPPPHPMMRGEVVRIEPPSPPIDKKPIPKPPCPPPLKGKMIRPDPPDPPPVPNGGMPAPNLQVRLIHLHPHDLDEPCFTVDDPELA